MSSICYQIAFDDMAIIIQTCLVDIPCLIMSVFTIVCMVQINLDQRKNQTQISNMFKYLLVKAVSDTAIFAIDVFNIRYYSSTQMSNSLAGAIWIIYFYNYIEYSLWYVSSLMEIGATLDCLISICKRCKWLISSLAFYVFVSVSFIFSFGFNSFVLFQFRITSRTQNVTINNQTRAQTSYSWRFTQYRFSDEGTNFIAAQAFIRDVAFLIIIVVLNIFIFLEIKKVTKRRIHMQNTSMSETTVTTKLVKDALHAERKKAWMILATGVNYFCGHIVYAIFQMATSNDLNLFRQAGWYCALGIGIELILLSYGTSFILYYLFNTQFKKFANQNVNFVMAPILKLFKCQ